MLKKAVSILLSAVLIFGLSSEFRPKAISFSPNDTINSDSAVLYNTDTGTIVYEKKSDAQKNPAHLVQIMTAIVTLEKKSNLTEKIAVPAMALDFTAYKEKYPEDEDSVITSEISEGEELSYEALLHIMLLGSSCESARTLAYYVGEGSVDNFVSIMNDTAKKIGCTNTNFTNPDGLYNENQYTTARDMTLITNYALKLPLFSEIVSKTEYNTGATNLDKDGIPVKNANVMMFPNSQYYYEGTNGIKTGRCERTGRCLISRATKDGSTYIVVLLCSPIRVGDTEEFTHIDDARMLFNWAFSKLKYQIVVPSTEEITTVTINYSKGDDRLNLRPAEDVSCIWPITSSVSQIDKNDIRYVYSELNAPVKAGTKIAEITLKYGGSELGTVDLVAYNDCEMSQLKYATAVVETYFKSTALKKAIKVWIILSVIYIMICLYALNKRAKRRREMRYAQNRQEKK